jgi:hypothetical protein
VICFAFICMEGDTMAEAAKGLTPAPTTTITAPTPLPSAYHNDRPST